ncbi:MAG: hypothetical protein LBH32_00405 [Dysgonamonadaceae bacterium]|jgi:ribosomal protein S13|nr:hypothetical protein [Dysgonamonadaceae bacterium]
MLKKAYYLLLLFMIISCTTKVEKQTIPSATLDNIIATLCEKDPYNKKMIDKGVKQIAGLWQTGDGDEKDFVNFCVENYIADSKEKEQVFLKISEYMEAISGNYNEMTLRLQLNVHEATGALHKIDESFAAYNPSAHLSDDLFANKTAFFIALNFPKLSLEEKESLGGDRLAWAYARLGDWFTSRVPAALEQAVSSSENDADVYISNYNIYAGSLLNKDGEKLFPDDMILLSHWNLRDEIKADYGQGSEGLAKQQTIYEVIKRIISQEIPIQAINSGDYDWNPFTNTLYQSGKEIAATEEKSVRYEKLLNNFKAHKAIDPYKGNTYIERNFSDNMEVSVEDAEKLFKNYLMSPEMKGIGKIISSRTGRNLEPFDIWYDGFKSRSNLNEEKLSEQTRALYPNAETLEKHLPNILVKLGFSNERAKYIADKIEVDAARGSGHALGASMRGQKSHLRTRIPENGMDYKGYNIAIHEFGHNVEQTLSLYDVDYYFLNGVPNTAFTEALAFVFQKRDLELLGIKNNSSETDCSDILDKAWQTYEIAGVSLVDIYAWKWMYNNPDATPEQLKEAITGIAKDVWNTYFYPVFGIKDEPVLAIYSHTISYPLYLSAYTFGQIIQFQLEEYLKGKDFAAEVDRIFRLGRLTPNQWIMQATGKPLSAEPLLEEVRKCLTVNPYEL